MMFFCVFKSDFKALPTSNSGYGLHLDIFYKKVVRILNILEVILSCLTYVVSIKCDCFMLSV